MKIKFNFWSFILSLLCIALFFIGTTSGVREASISLFKIHSLYIVLGISIITGILGVIGFSEAVNWKLLLRSIITITITSGVSAVTGFILFVGYLME